MLDILISGSSGVANIGYNNIRWGGLMAEIWRDGSDRMGYCEFAWSSENEGFENVNFEASEI